MVSALKIKTSLGEDTLKIDRLTGYEELSSPFEFELGFHSSSSTLDLASLLGTEVTVSFESYTSLLQAASPRHFCGIVGKVQQKKTISTEQGENITFYEASIYPKFWLLKFTKDYRIFPNKSAIDTILKVLKENGITEVENLVTTCGQTIRDYCVQYGESCFDFVCRLMEEEGIFYFFKHTEEGHIMVLTDDSSSSKPVEEEAISLNANQTDQAALNTILHFNLYHQVTTKDFQTVDYNYLTPLTALQPKVSGVGKSGRVYEYPGRFEKLDQGETLADMRLQALEWSSQLCQGSSTAGAFSAGKKFELSDHPRADFNKEYVLYKVVHTINQGHTPESKSVVYKNDFQAFPGEISFRPPSKTPKPRIFSNQTAIVTGPAGEEVFCDQYGRIKVQFHWDLYGKKNEESSCWIRVAQNWAGTNWGGLVTPRIGMEVVVTFIDGDPDRPLVIGCVYNADHMPPDYVTESPTKSTFKSNSSKKGGGFNELRFEDEKGSEEIYMHAQKDWNNEIVHSRTEDIFKGDDTLTIHKGNKSEIQKGQGTTHLLDITDGDDVIKITKGNYELTLENGNITINVTGKVDIISTDDISFKSAKNINLTAGMNIAMKSDMSIEQQAAMNIVMKSDMSIEQQAAMNIDSKAEMLITQQAALGIARKSDLAIKDEANMVQIEGKMAVELKGGSAVKIQAALVKVN
ncbi:type VI secretion system tip protein TssI/VgrG [Candidatus Finniella inopinata]|uniref:Type VI secretion system tip protein VgrG n=1 Tax=Candidatus Finniella inopinata TaxID=1696036 RepID=A0A4Q7DPK4_9PROT|nr:type VI secretion system tip protein TssI/VgrG [Candidatus Finniella inopinata]RZI46936.1 type VI secretion system tip protein VgrG [Candidatus Finniella inopinata]